MAWLLYMMEMSLSHLFQSCKERVTITITISGQSYPCGGLSEDATRFWDAGVGAPRQSCYCLGVYYELTYSSISIYESPGKLSIWGSWNLNLRSSWTSCNVWGGSFCFMILVSVGAYPVASISWGSWLRVVSRSCRVISPVFPWRRPFGAWQKRCVPNDRISRWQWWTWRSWRCAGNHVGKVGTWHASHRRCYAFDKKLTMKSNITSLFTTIRLKMFIFYLLFSNFIACRYLYPPWS